MQLVMKEIEERDMSGHVGLKFWRYTTWHRAENAMYVSGSESVK
jgi:hypothetical protein